MSEDNIRMTVIRTAEMLPSEKQWFDGIFERVEITAIGFSGNISLGEEMIAKERNLRPLNDFEQWLFKPVVDSEKKRRQNIFNEVMAEFLGEDPDSLL